MTIKWCMLSVLQPNISLAQVEGFIDLSSIKKSKSYILIPPIFGSSIAFVAMLFLMSPALGCINYKYIEYIQGPSKAGTKYL